MQDLRKRIVEEMVRFGNMWVLWAQCKSVKLNQVLGLGAKDSIIMNSTNSLSIDSPDHDALREVWMDYTLLVHLDFTGPWKKQKHVLQGNRQRKRWTKQSSIRECEGGPAISSEEHQPDRSSDGRTCGAQGEVQIGEQREGIEADVSD